MNLAERVSARTVQRGEIRRSDPVSMEEFGYLLGRSRGGSTRSKAGVTVTANRVLGIPAFLRGARWATEAVCFLPWATWRGPQGARVRRADPEWKLRPDNDMPWAALVEFWMMSMLLRGNCYSFKLRNPLDQVVGLRAVHPDRIKSVGRASDGTKVFEVGNGHETIPLTSRELLHIPGLSWDGVVGIDTLTYCAESLGSTIAADEFAARSFEGSHLRAYLSVPASLTVDQANAMKAQWQQAHAGITNADGFGVIGGGAEYHTISLTPEQVQLLDTRRFNVLDMARLIGCPPHKLYDLDRATFSNIEHQSIEATVDSIRPWTQRIETWVNADPDLLPDGNFVEGALEGLMRGDAASEAAAMSAAINGGWMTPQHAARVKNFPAPDDLNYYVRPLNVAVIKPGVGEVVPVVPGTEDA